MSRPYDVAVVGCGAGGYQAAVTAAQCGARVVLIEREGAGGACLNRACVPKKAVAHVASTLALARGLLGRGLAGTVSGDLAAMMVHEQALVADLQRGLPQRLKALAIDLVAGHARLVSAHAIAVTGDRGATTLEARRVILATGARSRPLASCPIDHDRVVAADRLIPLLASEPRRLLCLGGGATGVEAAFLFHAFGAEVTLATRGDRLLARPMISERAARLLERKLSESGVTILKKTSVAATRVDEAGVTVTFQDGHEGRFDRVLVAVGSVPRPDEIGYRALGVQCDAEGFVATRETLETSVPGIYAVGDMKGGPMTAAAALHDGRIAGENAALDGHRRRNYHQVPMVIDSILPLAAVGLSEDLAERAGFAPEVVYIPFGVSVKARAQGAAPGFIEIVHDEETGQMLGGCVAGGGADELVHLVLAACRSRRGLWSLADLDYGHPTYGEELGAAVSAHLAGFMRSQPTVFRPGIYASTE
ncbi:NAD(P)/FAD-dependent oxidoreductase [Acidiferrobacter sp.]|uniref:dihydrolipoyl dehydrogenase family protein n=1 Tax=Acidiferrobacter sp. TaxID=1872107 RepID=UPI0026247D36|nr:NAD(P)/FAD-dependent oxidoreductase [Acidiferrobacter sp.]